MIFSTGMGGFQAASRALQPASYALLALMGLFLTGKALLDASRGGLVAETSCPIDHEALGNAVNIRRVLMVSCVTGLVPCPGAAVILAFSIGLNIFWAGVAAIVLMAAGMGLTTTLFAWAAVAARGLTLRMSGTNAKAFNLAYTGLSICGAAAIALFGAALFVSSI
jgi:ABC-type nickel/cobalt efflux system permease component RcnA